MVKQNLWFRLPLAILTLIAVGLTQSSSISPASLTTSMLRNEIVISDLVRNEYRPQIAYNSIHDEYLVVWEYLSPGDQHSVFATRVSANGRLLGTFNVAPNPYDRGFPDVAYDPIHDRYLVVFSYDSRGDGSDWDINGRFIPWNGPDPELSEFGICIWSSNQLYPSVAFASSSQEFLVTWTNAPDSLPTYISARRVFSAGGFPAGDGFTVSSGTASRAFSDVAYNLARDEYLVTWSVVKSSSNLDIAGMRLDASGQFLAGGDPYQIGEFTIAGWPACEELPAVTACHDSDQYMVAWQSDQDTGGVDYAIYARFLSGEAVPGTVHLISDTTLPQIYPDIACDAFGKQYLLTWSNHYLDGESGIWARFAYPNGTLDPEFEVVGPKYHESRVNGAVMGGRRNFLTAWEHVKDGGASLDIHGRLIGYFLYLPLVIK